MTTIKAKKQEKGTWMKSRSCGEVKSHHPYFSLKGSFKNAVYNP